MKDIDEIRRDNMRIIETAAGSPTAAASLCSMSLAQWSNLRDGVKDSKTGKRRGMRKDTAINIATRAGQEAGWLDIDHNDTALELRSPPGPTYTVFKTQRDREIDEIEALLRQTDDRGLAILLDKARSISIEYPAVKKTPASSQ